MPTKPTYSISIAPPAQVIVQNGCQQFRATVLKGFPTILTASIVGPGGSALPLNSNVTWSWNAATGRGAISPEYSTNNDMLVIKVTGVTPGVVTVTLYASYTDPTNNTVELTNTVEFTVEEPYLSISPAQVIVQNGRQQFRATVLKGFPTTLTASIVGPGGSALPLNSNVTWSWSSAEGGGAISPKDLTNHHMPVIEVTGVTPGVVTLTLQASYTDPTHNTMEFTNTVELTVEEPYVSISPALVILEKNKVSGKMSPRFSTTIFKGFTTALTASIVGPGGAASGEHPTWWSWHVKGGTGSVTLSKSSEQQPVVEVTGLTAGVVTLHASYTDPTTNTMEFTNTVELTVVETDLLIYAPDGFVYRVPHASWSNPAHVHPMDKLSTSVQSLLIDQVPVANIRQPLPSPTGTSTTVGEPSDNITCFLLNLNSILLSPPAPTPATPPSGKPKPS